MSLEGSASLPSSTFASGRAGCAGGGGLPAAGGQAHESINLWGVQEATKWSPLELEMMMMMRTPSLRLRSLLQHHHPAASRFNETFQFNKKSINDFVC